MKFNLEIKKITEIDWYYYDDNKNYKWRLFVNGQPIGDGQSHTVWGAKRQGKLRKKTYLKDLENRKFKATIEI